MRSKTAFVAVLAMLVPALALPVMAAASSPASSDASSIFPPDWQDSDWPNMLAFKGIAVNDTKLVPAVLVAIKPDDGKFDTITLIIDGKSADVKIDGINRYPKNGAILLKMADGKGSLLFKQYQFDYRQAIVVSGEYDGWQLNMRLVGEAPIYRMMADETVTQSPTVDEQYSAAKPMETDVVAETAQ